MDKVTVRKGQGSVALSREEFTRRLREGFMIQRSIESRMSSIE
jgi:hypothetical protein